MVRQHGITHSLAPLPRQFLPLRSLRWLRLLSGAIQVTTVATAPASTEATRVISRSPSCRWIFPGNSGPLLPVGTLAVQLLGLLLSDGGSGPRGGSGRPTSSSRASCLWLSARRSLRLPSPSPDTNRRPRPTPQLVFWPIVIDCLRAFATLTLPSLLFPLAPAHP